MSFIGSKEYLYKVRQGEIAGAVIIDKFGSNVAIGATLTPVTTAGVYKTPSVLTGLEVLSDSVNDATGGTGATKIIVFGITTGFVETSEEVSLNGATPVALVNQYLRVYRLRVSESGTYADDVSPSHSSTITVRETGAGATWALIEPTTGFGLGTSEIGAFTIPAGKKGNLIAKHIFIETSKPATVVFFTRENADDVTAPYSGIMKAEEMQRGIVDNFHVHQDALGPDIIGPADIGFMASAASTASISVEFQLLITDI